MPHLLTRGLRVALDLALVSVAFWAAFLFRFEFAVPAAWARVALANWPFVAVIEYGALLGFGVHRYSWRYMGLPETLRIGWAIALSTAVLVTFRLLLSTNGHVLGLVGIPLGVLATNFFLSLVLLVGVRGGRRLYSEARERGLRAAGGDRIRVLLIGAGHAGVMVAREISSRPDLRLDPVGFIDDDPRKLRSHIAGLPVLGTTEQIVAIASRKRVKRVLITIANAPGDVIRQINQRCRDGNLETKIIPGIYEILGERVNLSRIREVAIEDLLGRAPVHLDEEQITEALGNDVVLVTGAGGSIGSELCRQVCRFSPARLVLVERFENSLFEIHRELISKFPDMIIDPCIADVCDAQRLEQVFRTFSPSVVFHAAAHKHVPMMEMNPGEAVKNNVGGTRVVSDLAERMGIERFVMVSTDKAVNPTSVMGATKRVAEMYAQALGRRSKKTLFVTVRFGNVLASNGSVVPIFKEQIAAGGPVKVTHPEMRRYFMTIPEASQLVLQAAAMGRGGEVFILDMGEPVKIVDLARDLITLSGFRPDHDIKVEFTGIRPGEKLFEELATDAESADKTKHPKIYIGRVPTTNWDEIARGVEELCRLARDADGDAVRVALSRLVPEYTGAPRGEEEISATSDDIPRLVATS